MGRMILWYVVATAVLGCILLFSTGEVTLDNAIGAFLFAGELVIVGGLLFAVVALIAMGFSGRP